MRGVAGFYHFLGRRRAMRTLFPVGEGSHATPSEVSVTWFGYPQAQKHVPDDPAHRPHRPNPGC